MLLHYNGERVPKTYLIQVQLVAQFNAWLVEKMEVQVILALEDKALQIFTDLQLVERSRLRERCSTGSADSSSLTTPRTSWLAAARVKGRDWVSMVPASTSVLQPRVTPGAHLPERTTDPDMVPTVLLVHPGTLPGGPPEDC